MKIKIKKTIYSETFNSNYNIRFSDLPKDIKEDDIIDIRREDSYVSENNSYYAYTELMIIREIEETDEQYAKRIEREERLADTLRKRRYETYLKMKEEFEPLDQNISIRTKNIMTEYLKDIVTPTTDM